MKVIRTMLLLISLCCSLSLVSCTAISVRSLARTTSPPMPLYFGGVRGDYDFVFHPGRNAGMGWPGPIYGAVDMPFSLVADVVALPYDAYTSYEWSRATNITFVCPSNPQSGANGRQPSRQENVLESPAAASRRSP